MIVVSLTLRATHHPDCYPSDPKLALAFFRKAWDLVPPDKLPPAPESATLAGILTPHIDFRVSPASYAAAFRPLLDEPLAEKYLIIGVGHRSRLEWNFDRRDYLTPLGRAECDEDLVDALTYGIEPARLFSPAAHEGEHSIEFPLLWLQALHRLHPEGGTDAPPVRFVPLLCGALHAYVEGMVPWEKLSGLHHFGQLLQDIFAKNPPGEKLRIIVSIDGCHIGSRFQHTYKVTKEILAETAAWEEKLWACVSLGDAHTMLDWFRTERNERYFDGVGALALLLASAPEDRAFIIQRTFYEQWFTKQDASAVTFSSGRVLW